MAPDPCVRAHQRQTPRLATNRLKRNDIWRRITRLGALGGLLPCAILLASAADAQLGSLGDGVYTRQQAKFGERLYKTHCVACHDRNYFGPVLKAWAGQPLSALYETMYWTMPQANPGGLQEHEYLALLAYVLSLNRLPSGAAELNAERLSDILIRP